MKRVLATTLLLAAGLLLVSFSPNASAQGKGPVDETKPETGPNCDITGYKTERQVVSVAIPDNNPAGVDVGNIFFPDDGDIIRDTIIDLQMEHTWVGDLIVTVIYDPDCEGPLAGIPTNILCRQRGTGITTPAPCGTGTGVGSSSDLSCNNLYVFSDEALTAISDGTNPTLVGSGCYKPSQGPLSVWNGLRKGGCFSMHIADHAALDLGRVCVWSVSLRNERPVAAFPTSWGNVKSIYR